MVLINAIDDTVLAVYLLVTLSISVHRGLRRRQRPQATLMTSGPSPAPSHGPGHPPANTSVMSVAVFVVATFMSAVFALGESRASTVARSCDRAHRPSGIAMVS